MIGLIWAQAANGVIGRGNEIPWHVPEDMAHFREITAGSTVLMGRRTWQSLPARFRPLPDRRNLVLSRDPDFAADGAEVVHDLAAALAEPGEVWVMGGANVYAEAMPKSDVIEQTVLREPVEGDVFAPVIGPDWTLDRREPDTGWHHSTSALDFRWLSWSRKDIA